MKTISARQKLNARFKEAQLLPVLSPEMLSGRVGFGSKEERPDPMSYRTGPPADARPLVWRAEHCPSERVVLGLLGLSACLCVTQVLVAKADWTGGWYVLATWVNRLVG